MFSRIYNNESVKSRRLHIRQLKTDNEDIEIDARSRVTHNNETIKSEILAMGKDIESIYRENDMDFLVSSISETVISILEKDALEDLISYAIDVLPREYKNPNRSRAPQLQSQSTLSKLKEETEKNIEEKFSHLKGKDDLKQAHDLKLQELKALESICEEQEVSLLPDERSDESASYNQLNELDRLQEERFSEKASIGAPLDVIDTTEEDQNRIQAAIQEYIDTVYDYKEEIKKFPPINHDTAMGIVRTFQVKTQALRPFTDDKFRRSYPQWFEIIRKKIEVSATNAAKISAIAAAHRVNPKTGQPIMRSITKEQIDSMAGEHLNFIVEWFNEENYNSDYWLTKAFEENKCRCLEDRAIDLHDKLSHLS